MDKNKGKYQNIYGKEFALAKFALKNDDGRLEWANADYQAFTYKSDEVTLIFYPHKTTANNYHIRVRSQNSRSAEKANDLMAMLDKSQSWNCTFTYKKAAKQ